MERNHQTEHDSLHTGEMIVERDLLAGLGWVIQEQWWPKERVPLSLMTKLAEKVRA